jgi:recombination protein RecT
MNNTLTVKDFLSTDNVVQRIKTALIKNTDAERFLLLAKIELSKDKNFEKCDGASILQCLVKVASLGLYIGAGDAFLAPYKNKRTEQVTCSMLLGYQGMLKLLYRGGMESLTADVVFAGDQFEFQFGTENKIIHKRTFKDRGEFLCAYAVANINGRQVIEMMDKNEIDHCRSRSKFEKEDSPWKVFFNEMAKKTVIKRLFKKMPQENFDLSVIEAIRNDDRPAETDCDTVILNGENRSDAIAEII